MLLLEYCDKNMLSLHISNYIVNMHKTTSKLTYSETRKKNALQQPFLTGFLCQKCRLLIWGCTAGGWAVGRAGGRQLNVVRAFTHEEFNQTV